MKKYKQNDMASVVREGEAPFMRTYSSQEEAELHRLERDIDRPDMEKFRLFTQMLRRNALFKRATIVPKPNGQ